VEKSRSSNSNSSKLAVVLQCTRYGMVNSQVIAELEHLFIHGRIYSRRGPVQKKCGAPSPIVLLEKNWRLLVITVCVSAVSLLKN